MDWILQLFDRDTSEIEFYNAIRKTATIVQRADITGDTLPAARRKLGSVSIRPYEIDGARTDYGDPYVSNRCLVKIQDAKITKVLIG